MKKFAIIMAVFATLVGNAAFAQNNTRPQGGNMGAASQGASATSSSGMAWGIGLGGLAVVGAVVGGAVAGATSSTSGGTFSH